MFGGPFASAEPQEHVYDVYLKLEGFSGDSVTKGYEKWIALNDNVKFGVENTSVVAGSGTGIAISKPTFNGIQFTKPTDSASIQLMQAAAMSTVIKSASIVFVKAGATGTKPFLTVDLTDVVLNSYSFDGGVETIKVGYSSINMSYTALKADGTAGATIKGGFDLKKLIKI
ncbi:type VI secretion system tube protein Hcp [Paenibacillus lupini]|uniref:Hcp family type VI secretion system effector n=1 Tax=Paenibacillus lupini TaxID=1450204 RepID=UPI0014202572|nr:type VI secretion system tube protein Hcp [Paenibacillus lupini]NIK23134.1 type VI protein secretion system component Hcp [Paenibacillus lupini]